MSDILFLCNREAYLRLRKIIAECSRESCMAVLNDPTIEWHKKCTIRHHMDQLGKL